MNRMLVGAVALAMIGAVAGCASTASGGATHHAASSSSSPTKTVVAPPPTPTDPNPAICEQVHAMISDRIQPTFAKWHPDTDTFNQTVGNELRDEATSMYTLAAKATGSYASAIQAEAKGLTDLSVGISESDESAVGTAANEANSALAALRGTCNF